MAELLTPKQKSAVERAKRTPELQPILFRDAKGLRWYEAFQEAGFLDPKAVPPPMPSDRAGYMNIPHWPITEYLLAASAELQKPGNEAYAERILDFIRSATYEAQSKGFSNYRVWWQFSKIMPHIPAKLLSTGDFEMVDFWLDDRYDRGMVASVLGKEWIESLMSQKDGHSLNAANTILGLIYKVTLIEKGADDKRSKELVLRVDGWHAKNIIKEIGTTAGEALGPPAVEVFRRGLDIYLEHFKRDKLSSVWRRAIEDNEQNSSAFDADDLLIEGFRETLLGLVTRPGEEAINYVKGLLGSDLYTIRRLGIYATDKAFEKLKPVLDLILVEQNFHSNLRHELWHLLNNHYPQMSLAQKRRVFAIIAGLTETDEGGSTNEGATAYKRAIWLSAIRDFDATTKEAYEAYVAKAGEEPEHPDFSSYMRSGFVTHKSPYEVDDLLSLNSAQFVERLNSYKGSGDFWGPNIEGLAKAVRQVVLTDPLRFSRHLQDYVELEAPYMYEFVDAFNELWGKNTTLPWDEIWPQLLNYFAAVVNGSKFWEEGEEPKQFHFVPNRRGVVDAMGRLIENGVRNDAHTFSPDLMVAAESIIFVLLSRENGSEFKVDDDAVSIAINSPRGRCLEALVNLSLRACRLADAATKEHASAWSRFEAVYSEELKRTSSGAYEFVTLVAMYVPQFLYMSKNWTVANLPKIFASENYQAWLCAMQGYSYVASVNAEVYDFLNASGNYLKGLDDPNLKDQVSDKIIQNICVGFLYDHESLDDPKSLISTLLQRAKPDELHQLIWFIWTIRANSDEKLHAKVLQLWTRLVTVIDPKTEQERQLMAELSDWSIYVEKLDPQTKNLILTSAKYSGGDYHSHVMMESIARFSETQPEEAFEIWMALLASGRGNPDFPPDAVEKALVNLCETGTQGTQNAKKIAGEYMKRGNRGPMRLLEAKNSKSN